jgi:hypothetical protein
MEKSLWAIFSAAGPALHRPRPTPVREASCYHAHALVADDWDPPVSSRFPQSPPLLRPIPTTDAILAKPRHEHPAKAASCCPVPSSRCWSMIVGRIITSPLLRHHRSAVPSLHGRDADARSSTMRPHAAHPTDGAGTAKGVPSRPRRSPADVHAWPPRCGALACLLAPRGHRSAHPFQRG